MTAPVYRGEVQLLDWGHTRSSGPYVKFQMHIDDLPDGHPFLGMERGERFAIIVVPFTDEEPAIETQPAWPIADAPDPQVPGRAEKPKRCWSELSRAQQAGIRCSEERFRQWLSIFDCPEQPPLQVFTPEAAAEAVRRRCGVKSRAHLDRDTQWPPRWDWDRSAAEKWDALDAEYVQDMGLLPEDRS